MIGIVLFVCIAYLVVGYAYCYRAAVTKDEISPGELPASFAALIGMFVWPLIYFTSPMEVIVAEKHSTHSLERTSPLGEAFVGTCVLCGQQGLAAKDANNPCQNPRGIDTEQVVVDAVDGPAEDAMDKLKDGVIPAAWLQGPPLVVSEVEAEHTLVGDALTKALGSRRPELRAEIGRPFGFINDRWEALKAKMVEGDELWAFNNGKEAFARLAGRAGYAVVRNGKAIAAMIVVMS